MQPGDPAVPTGEVVELLRQLIRNRCVNDGTPDSGEEVRNADTLADYLAGAGLDVERFAPRPGRTSIVARIEGRDRDAPRVCLMGHTDVVPVNEAGWDEDPFAADLIGDELWGRGAVDMLNLTASMAAVARRLASLGRRPPGDLIFLGVADEEAAGTWGAGWLATEHWDAIGCDYVLTENGGLVSGRAGGRHVLMNVAEKGFAWRRLVVRGTPGHGSMPFGADNALLTAAEVVSRLGAYRPRAEITDLWRRRVATLDLAPELREAMLRPDRVTDAIAGVAARGAAAHFHACTHTTFSPNLAHGGVKTNVIPDRVEIDVDIRTLPGETPRDGRRPPAGRAGRRAVPPGRGDLARRRGRHRVPADTPLWSAMEAATRRHYPDCELVPGMIVGLTDARFFRDRGTVAYGAGLMSDALSGADFASRFHGHNERIDLRSIELTTDFFWETLQRFWS